MMGVMKGKWFQVAMGLFDHSGGTRPVGCGGYGGRGGSRAGFWLEIVTVADGGVGSKGSIVHENRSCQDGVLAVFSCRQDGCG